jgi:hypothetical protein
VSLERIKRVCRRNASGDRRATGFNPAAAYANHDTKSGCIYQGNDAKRDPWSGSGRKPGYLNSLVQLKLRPLRNGDVVSCKYREDAELVRAE